MAPILLKIKGTKLFSPFDEIEDVGDLSTLWRVCTKVKDSLENGSRLENLSWRLWHLHQSLEARGEGRDYRKLSPATTKQLEKTIRRPVDMRKSKPVQIKVRLGKTNCADSNSNSNNNGITAGAPNSGKGGHYHHHHHRRNGSSNAKSPRLPPQAKTAAQHQPQQRHVQDDPAAPESAAHVTPDTATAHCTLEAAAPSPPHPPRQSTASSNATEDPNINASTTAAATEATAVATEEVQASDFMSFGPSSFLSNGFDLDVPQIEITLDDIFSANSADWSQFGFGPFASGNPAAMGLSMAGYGSGVNGAGGPGVWGANGGNGMPPYPGGPMPVSAPPYGTPGQPPYSMDLNSTESPKEHEGPICANCGVTSTPLWRRSVDDTLLCNACGLYYKLHRSHRPKTLRASASRKEGEAPVDLPKTYCSNCNTSNTPLWRRDEEGNPLCNACGLYYKLHKENRPSALKTDVIRKRQRFDTSASTTTPRKRQDRRPRKRAATTAGTEGTEGIAETQSTIPVEPDLASSKAQGKRAVAAPRRSRKGKRKDTPLQNVAATDVVGSEFYNLPQQVSMPEPSIPAAQYAGAPVPSTMASLTGSRPSINIPISPPLNATSAGSGSSHPSSLYLGTTEPSSGFGGGVNSGHNHHPHLPPLGSNTQSATDRYFPQSQQSYTSVTSMNSYQQRERQLPPLVSMQPIQHPISAGHKTSDEFGYSRQQQQQQQQQQQPYQ